MEMYKCRFCFKRFINGRALGGHMRSHITNLNDNKFNVAEEQEQEQEHPSQLSDETESYPSSSSSTSSSSSEEGEITQNEFIKKPKIKNNQDFTYTNSSETEFNLTQQRFKKTRKLDSFQSSISDTTTEEDLAFCLMMLSRDDNKWKRKKKKIIKGRFKCETCYKVFKSYQALGGHRASHKKNKIYNKTDQIVITEDKKIKKLHQCPICLRVFSSGQALGGHKRSHGINGGLSLINQVESVNGNVKMIDLNLPATMEDFQ